MTLALALHLLQAKKKLYTAAQLTAGTVVARKAGKPAADQEPS